MAVVLQSASRERPLPCQHFLATVADGARTVQVRITMQDLLGSITDEEVAAVLKLWARYQLANGKTLGQLAGGTIFSVIP